ncbi:MAG: 30S ribosomal protein S20 [Xanthomonadales bacterium]|nr:30S ribosomal protein S20 [Xanthomonadales bacterium]
MANSAQARKRAKPAKVARERNMSQRSMTRTSIKKVVNAIESGDKDAAQAAYTAAVPVIDRMARKGLLHANKAARHKSRLSKRIQAL